MSITKKDHCGLDVAVQQVHIWCCRHCWAVWYCHAMWCCCCSLGHCAACCSGCSIMPCGAVVVVAVVMPHDWTAKEEVSKKKINENV